jgi:hypothetical protein
VVAKVKERRAVSKKTTNNVPVERFNPRKLNEIEVKEQIHVEISDRFTALENLDTEVNIDRAWETTGWCIK